MKSLKDFTINFVGLKQGTHNFDYEIDNKFFKEFDFDDFSKANFRIALLFEKQSTLMQLTFSFKGNVTVPCDRCLDDVDIPVEGEERLIVKFGNEESDNEEILVLPEQEYQINVAQYIYEFIEIHIPQKRVHPEGECNIEVVNKLEELSKNNTNNIDPRWGKLNELK